MRPRYRKRNLTPDPTLSLSPALHLLPTLSPAHHRSLLPPDLSPSPPHHRHLPRLRETAHHRHQRPCRPELHRPNVHRAVEDPGIRPLIRADPGRNQTIAPRINDWAAGQRQHRLRRAAIAGQRPQHSDDRDRLARSTLISPSSAAAGCGRGPPRRSGMSDWGFVPRRWTGGG